jgi:hypothetical protein
MAKNSSQSSRANRDPTEDPLAHAKGDVSFGNFRDPSSGWGPENEGAGKLFDKSGDVKQHRGGDGYRSA